ncbi:MAG: hypothetical protein U5N21_14300 [Rhodococcus sp. (in: high G+C Gram-positive bacteria)]|uniref:hypothetical protein n=1 Tax=Rhodococcus sp. TaxID=1831 RepID=UPI002ADA8BCB|nr:hypothetical protein [Rhodococcus sp. (in: high G+C Gram-positive bacteria)]MDZ7931146.1 hypothetical protein [Rhodococcus sp. (in: high G+C Gram-positive bacteria)]
MSLGTTSELRESSEVMDEDAQPPARHPALLNTLVIVSIVALGVVAAGLTTPDDEPELTATPTTSETPVPQPTQEYVYVTPEVDPSASIPGCDTVEAPTEPSYSSFITTGDESYDNPAAPWYSGPKAHVMSEALMAALPSNISASNSLYFEPIPSSESQSIVFDSANASTQLSYGENPEYLSVGVGPRDSVEPLACVAGQLDERRALPDGTVVDTDDTWSETNGARTYTRMATAYHSDRSTVSVYLAGGDDENAFTLSLDDLVRVATDPNLRISAPVPPGTPGNVTGCSAGWDDSSSASFSPDETRRLNDALRRADATALAPTPPLGALHTSEFGSGLCQTVNSTAGQLTISVTRATPDIESDSTTAEEPQLVSPEGYGPGSSVETRTPSGLDITVSTTQTMADPALLQNFVDTVGLDVG